MSAKPDWNTAAELDNEYWIAHVIDADGNAWPWLVKCQCPDCAHGAVNGCHHGAIHEREGRLPREYLERLGMLCGAPTSTTGRPCRNYRPCSKHTDNPATQSGNGARANV
ncbi:hypothetical protein [Haloactinopolyspora alba]|uniref:hypothetical protein n=1 Tax=Haloactinopolyspora alba TaxID=648780 RepID=UPI00101B9DA5|nr:hypothetical protein [Haloactinopolyspora alba]